MAIKVKQKRSFEGFKNRWHFGNEAMTFLVFLLGEEGWQKTTTPGVKFQHFLHLIKLCNIASDDGQAGMMTQPPLIKKKPNEFAILVCSKPSFHDDESRFFLPPHVKILQCKEGKFSPEIEHDLSTWQTRFFHRAGLQNGIRAKRWRYPQCLPDFFHLKT